MSDTELKLRAGVNALAPQIDAAAERAMGKRTGFALLLFEFHPGNELAWISSANRQDMIKAVREFLQRLEGGGADREELS